ncbi:MAG: formate C-acetyltransferase [Ruminococcaceae bacterium]|nr:formate C-acetyltransferase [Oscillospiraceae bacterium]
MSFWNNFKGEKWKNEIDVADFIDNNYTEYTGDDSFLASKTDKTTAILEKTKELFKKEHDNGGVLDVDVSTVTSLVSYDAGYVDKDNEVIVGLQTDEPLKRGVNPFGGIRMARSACEAYGYKLSDEVEMNFKYKTTHNDGVFRVYTDEMRKVRKAGILTGLPDAYGRGRIIGDYRRVALYGVDRLIEEKMKDKALLGKNDMSEDNIRLSEELFKQIEFLNQLKEMAKLYGLDISKPAKDAKEAVQWLYFAYLGAIKEQNGAAMSLGRNTAFLDIYIKRDMDAGILDEKGAQELIDQFVLKLRIVRHLRTPEYNDLFGGDPVWITESIGGMRDDKKSHVTKTAFRFMHTLYNLGTAPEPNITILWSENLPENFKKYVAKVSIDTDSIQYENDDVMKPVYGNDYAIACCVSGMQVGKQMQFFGARCNLAKLLLMSLNGGRNEKTGDQVGPVGETVSCDVLDYSDVMKKFNFYKEWLCRLYVNTMNVIHYMHDKYAYEKVQMALHDTEIGRFMAFGVAGLSVLCDSLSAIKYAKVTPVKNEDGIVCDFIVEGDFPKFGNDDDRVDSIACDILKDFYNELCKTKTYRNAKHTLSVLTITSNVVYGKKTGTTPDGRKSGEPFAPGANPMHNRETNGALASLNSVSKICYDYCQDGISNTFSIVPEALGKSKEERIDNLVTILGGYFKSKAHHINVNVLNRDVLIDCYNNPEKYPNLTIRVSGYAVNFHKLNKEQQQEVIKRTFHGSI